MNLVPAGLTPQQRQNLAVAEHIKAAMRIPEPAKRAGAIVDLIGTVGEENPFTIAARTCDVQGCDALAVPGETHECADHQIITCIEIMAEITALPANELLEIDCYTYGVCQLEIERLRAL